jgi:hypothetical protein
VVKSIVIPWDLLERMIEVRNEMAADPEFYTCEWEVDGVMVVLEN